MSIKAQDMLNRVCPFIDRKCMGDECVNWKSANVTINAHTSVWGDDGTPIVEGRSKCRLWVDTEEYMRE